MAVFPESMNRLNREDVSGSLGIIENYIRYITERVEFSNKNMTRTVSAAGTSSVEILQHVLDLANAVAIIQSTVSGMVGDITGLGTRIGAAESNITDLSTRVLAAESGVDSLEGRMDTAESNITALSGRMDTAESNITALQTAINDLTARVAALEGGTT